MTTFTTIRDGQFAQVVSTRDREINGVFTTAREQFEALLQEGETYIDGGYSRTEYKLVDGQPVELSAEERTQPPKPPSASKLMMMLAKDVKKSGISTTMTIENNLDNWTKDDAVEAIYQVAGRARARNIAPGYLIEQEYQRLIVLVDKWITQGSDVNQVPAMLQSYATHSHQTLSDAANTIVQASLDYDDLLARIYDKRHEAMAVINTATDNFYDVAKPFINQLEGMT
jgi:hypothetical protein